jgi:hypothetical protein
MKSGSMIGLIQFCAAGLLIIVSYLSFSQTLIYQQLTEILANSLNILLPFTQGHLQIAEIIISLSLAAVAITVALLGRRSNIKHLCYLSFLLFLPSTQPFAAIDWLSFIGIKSTLLSYSTLTQTLISGIILLFCYFLLNSVSRLKETKNELTNRGGNPPEVDAAIKTGIAYTVTIASISGILAATAAFLLVAGQSVATAFTQNLPYANIILGLSSIIAITTLVYYYLKERSP